MAVEKLIQYQITAVQKHVDCCIQVSGVTPRRETLVIGSKRYMAVSVDLILNKKSHPIGFVPDHTAWEVVPLIESTFNLAFELGKKIGANQLNPDDKVFSFLPA